MTSVPPGIGENIKGSQTDGRRTHTTTDRHKDKHTDRHRGKHADTYTDTDRQRGKTDTTRSMPPTSISRSVEFVFPQYDKATPTFGVVDENPGSTKTGFSDDKAAGMSCSCQGMHLP